MAKGTVTVSVSGVNEIAQRFARLRGPEAQKILRVAASSGAAEIKKKAKENLVAHGNVQTGALLKSVQVRRNRRSAKPGFEEYSVGVFRVKAGKYVNNKANVRAGRAGKEKTEDPPTYYWRFVEFGTVHMSAKPFLRPALESSQGSAFNAVQAKLDKAITKIESRNG